MDATIKYLLAKDREENLEYFENQMEEILSGVEKILEFCTPPKRVTLPQVPVETPTTKRFPTALIESQLPGRFPSARSSKFQVDSSSDSNLSNNSDDVTEKIN